MCVCGRERQTDRQKHSVCESKRESASMHVCVRVRVCDEISIALSLC